MKKVISIKVVSNKGEIDKAAMEAAFREELAKLAAPADSVDPALVEAAVHNVFDRFPEGTRILMPQLLAYAMVSLDVAPASYTRWEEAAHRYVRSMATAVEPEFHIGKGTKGGGVLRLTKPKVAEVQIEAP